VIVVADSSKIGRRGFARISELAAVSDLVTDSGVSASDVRELERSGLRVHRAAL
jgi:DeoR family transcriptional regulator of aga operon